MEHEVLLTTENLHTYFSTKRGVLKAVNGIDLSIREGESLGLVGESGCGKSTLGKTLMRIYQPSHGKILFRGEDISTLSRKKAKDYTKRVQMIFQDPYASLDPLFVIGDSIAEGIAAHRTMSRAEAREKTAELLDLVGLNPSSINRYPHEFSGGQRQRVGIARAISLDPELIICDEPISALDVSIQAQIVNLLRELQQSRKMSYLFITHDLSMVRQISERIAVMYLGKLVEIAPSSRIYDRTLHPYTKALLSAIPIANPDVEEKRKRIPLTGDVPSPIDLPKGCSFCNRCGYCKEICREEVPALREIEKDHFVACHFVENFL